MFQGTVIAGFLSACLTTFLAVNAYNMIKKTFADRANAGDEGKVEVPRCLPLVLGVLGTGAFFLLSLLYIVLVAAGLLHHLTSSALQLTVPLDLWLQLLGMALTAGGYALFLWSVLARGEYATSWQMPSNQELVTWGPYRYVRHPSYTAYFIMFIGLMLLLLNLLALIPFVAVPGYMHIAGVEDDMLRSRFGDAARQYQKATGRFLPRRRRGP